MSELLLELLSEEIPALMQTAAATSYLEIFTKTFIDNEIAFDSLKVFAGSRRITLYVTGLPKTLPAKILEIKGPRLDASESVIASFCKAHSITKEQLAPHNSFYIHKKQQQIIEIKQLLLELLPKAISSYSWPKSMYWNNYSLAWVRPLTNILCILDRQLLPITLAHLTANDYTYGHKFLSKSKLENIQSFEDYQQRLAQNKVIIDGFERKKMIEEQLQELTKRFDLTLNHDPKLLEEITGLIEYPTVMIGTIAVKFLKLPPEVLITSMRTHQKYITAFDKNGNFAPYFLFVSNNYLLQYQDNIIAGNEKVLSARLSDALYFYEQDLKTTAEHKAKQLKQTVFHAKLGSMFDKSERVAQICNYLFPKNRPLRKLIYDEEFLGKTKSSTPAYIDIREERSLVLTKKLPSEIEFPERSNEDLQIAAKLCKTDLVSEMVQEFPELQGIMGYYYAKSAGLHEEIAIAIRDHYKPQGLSDNVPTSMAAQLALADKLDSLITLMSVGEKATSSKDPYALRRYAIAIIRIILTNKFSINSQDLSKIFEILNINDSNFSGFIEFLQERVKFYFKEQYDLALINAVLDLRKQDLLTIAVKLEILQTFTGSNEGQALISAYKRINNILDNNFINTAIQPKLLQTTAEVELNEALNKIAEALTMTFATNLELLIKIIPYLDNFFDKVLVNDENPELRHNRLSLLYNIKQLFLQIANFDYL
ncbi:Glycine--tRNA ligase beta subunit [Candidatus Trichorickettsia mobilis]|uniref:Glycine--tRNA ligase beta subunit n=1 Tax=Candidatus Trichorickettsia mobilis TaxID=1346319 RepID=A0ABZ0UU29_9RICK|nr:glycine--tRNA ligase subunit beta [Candidatus Trichorickettsia mobilis]WPY01311.1 Glycine--tRNA ligase beta subunit [Candidatus Trichorickettsia mobilis]